MLIQDKEKEKLPNKYKGKDALMIEAKNQEKQKKETDKGVLFQPLSLVSPDENLSERFHSFEGKQQPHKVDLVEIMKNLQLEIPGDVEYVFTEEAGPKPEENTQFKLLIKVACTGGPPRNIPLQPLNEAMSRAWGENYWVIDQVKSGIYIAYFRDEEAMDFVLQRQPWSVDNDNLLIEWINPRNADKPVENYEFKYVYAQIRVYGVPERFRGPHLMNYVIEKVAMHSDLHPPPEQKITYRREYISAYAKFDVTKHVRDKVKYYISPDQFIVFYLNFEKIKRICTFCGVMFHIVEHCTTRRRLILHLQSIGESTATVPFSYLGIWMAQPSKIPSEASDQANLVGGLSEAFRKQMRVDRSSSSAQLTLSQFATTRCSSEKVNRSLMTDQGLLGNRPVTNSPADPKEVYDANLCPSIKNNNAQQVLLDQHTPIQLHAQQHPSSIAGAVHLPVLIDSHVRVGENEVNVGESNYASSKPNVAVKRASEGLGEGEDDSNEKDLRKVRFRSAPPPSPQYSGTASSNPIFSETRKDYMSFHMHHDQADNNQMDNPLNQLIQQEKRAKERDQCRKFRSKQPKGSPSKGRGSDRISRWDKKGPANNAFIPMDLVSSPLPNVDTVSVPLQVIQTQDTHQHNRPDDSHIPRDMEGVEGNLQQGVVLPEAAAPAFKAPWSQ